MTAFSGKFLGVETVSWN